MIHIIHRGILIGILVSAPMGPIGLLCLQRTLYKGRWHGFFSGVGAAFSDLFYALITCMGMGIVIAFIEDNQSVLQIAGSILLMLFGIYTYKSDPSKSLRKPKHTYSFSQDALSAFFLTFSNPFIIFLFIALFARFNFISPDEDEALHSVIIGLISIFAGAVLWWFILTTVVGKLRKVFKERGLLIMNRFVGIVIIILSIVGIILSLWDLFLSHLL
jgi:threonine/homoserine/homoserine lactone efflux protein